MMPKGGVVFSVVILIILGCISCTNNAPQDTHQWPIIEDAQVNDRVAFIARVASLDDVRKVLPDPIAAKIALDSEKIPSHTWEWHTDLKKHLVDFVATKRTWRKNNTKENRAEFLRKLQAMRRHIIRSWASYIWNRYNYTEEPTPLSVLYKEEHITHASKVTITSERTFLKEVIRVFQKTSGPSNTDLQALEDLSTACQNFWALQREQSMRAVFTTPAPLITPKDIPRRVNIIAGLHARPHRLDGLASLIQNPVVAKNASFPSEGHSIHMRILRKNLWPTIDEDLKDVLNLQTARYKARTDVDKTAFLRAIQKVRDSIVYIWAAGFWSKHNASLYPVPFHSLVLKARIWPLDEGAPAYKIVTNATEFAQAMQWSFQRTCGPYGADVDTIVALHKHVSQFISLAYKNHLVESTHRQFCDKIHCSCMYTRGRFILPLRPYILGKKGFTITATALKNIRTCIANLMAKPLEPVRLHALTYNPLACNVGSSANSVLYQPPYTMHDVPPPAPPAHATTWWPAVKTMLQALAKDHAEMTPNAAYTQTVFVHTRQHKNLRKRICGLWALALWERCNTLNKPTPFGPYEILTKEKFQEAVETFFDKEAEPENNSDAFKAYTKTMQTLLKRAQKCVEFWEKSQKNAPLRQGRNSPALA